MALNIKNDEAEALAREISARTGESITAAVTEALRERAARLKAPSDPRQAAIARIQARVRARLGRDRDPRPVDDILGYDEHGTFDA